MNNLQNLLKLKNRYFVMRHGQSRANVQQIIISHPENGVHSDYGLTELGREQAAVSAAKSSLTSETIIYSSDFSRAFETAKIVQKALGISEIHITEKLRERHFGDYEKTDHGNYHKVWNSDKESADHDNDNVESVNSVLKRVTDLILDIEESYEGKDILLVSHGDTLQILQTGFQRNNPTQHRELAHLETAEIREMQIQSS